MIVMNRNNPQMKGIVVRSNAIERVLHRFIGDNQRYDRNMIDSSLIELSKLQHFSRLGIQKLVRKKSDQVSTFRRLSGYEEAITDNQKRFAGRHHVSGIAWATPEYAIKKNNFQILGDFTKHGDARTDRCTK